MNMEMERRKQEIELVCRHEAGHYIMARDLGFVTNGVKINIYWNAGHKASAGIIIWNPGLENLESIKSFLEKRIKVLYAGVVAESISSLGQYDSKYALKQWEEGGGQMDHANIRELVRFLRDLIYPQTNTEEQANAELKKIDDRILNEVGILLMERISLINIISEHLAKKVIEFNTEYELTENELNEIVANHDLNKKNRS